AAYLAHERRSRKIWVVIMLNGHGLHLPQDITIVVVQLEDAVGVVGRWYRVTIRATFMDATVASRHHNVAARSDSRGTPYASARGRPSHSRKTEPGIEGAGGQINGEDLADGNGSIGPLGRNANIGTAMSNGRRGVANLRSSASRCCDCRFPNALAAGR